MNEFRGKTAVVTGAASGIGRGLADRFAAEGMNIVLADVHDDALQAAASEMSDAGHTVLAVRTDVARADQVDALAQKAVERFGAVHVVCNNAGVGSGGFVWEQPLEDFEWVLNINLWGVIHGVRAFVPIMLKQGEEGHIVNTASMAGLLAGPMMGAYNVSKFAVVALSETLHHELQMASGGKIGVSVLCPGFVNTNIHQSSLRRPSGAPPEPAPGSPEAAGRDAFLQMMASGMAPSEVARQVFEAVRDRRFYILTHEEFKPRVLERAQTIVDGRAPGSPGFV
jgi:NAD(P)-dependent dehydrogenase (short-subunit alcohol dehydrogenase family)